MLPENFLKDVLQKQELKKLDKLLLCLASDIDNPKSIKQINKIALKVGLRIEKWNSSAILALSKGLAIRTPEGWELTSGGREYVSSIIANYTGTPTPIVLSTLRDNLAKIPDQQTRAFIEEAIQCYENHFYRAAVVLSWIGAISVLYNYLINNQLNEFNTEALRRDTRWKIAKTEDDLAKMKESDFLDILEAISVIGKSVKQELKKCLDLRNGCGHPNSLHIGEIIVAAHIETLILNVFSQKFI